MPLDLKEPVLCLVTDRTRLGCVDVEGLLRFIRLAVTGGVDLVQIRERDLSDRDFSDLVRRAVEQTQGSGTRIIVNDRMDIALSCGAAGVHLRGDSVATKRIRVHTPADWIVGRSVHSLAEAKDVVSEAELDYVFLGSVFETLSKPGKQPLGVGILRDVAAALPVPVLGIGGITLERVELVATAGAGGLAAIGLFAELAKVSFYEFRSVIDNIRERWKTTSPMKTVTSVK